MRTPRRVNVAQANRQQVPARKSAVSTMMAQMEQARASEAQMTTQLGYTKIYAPIDGMVSVRVAKQGEVVSIGAPIVVVVDINHLWVRAERRGDLRRCHQVRPKTDGGAAFGKQN